MVANIQSSSYLALPEVFYQTIRPNPVSGPRFLKFNDSLASNLNLVFTAADTALQFLSGNDVPHKLQTIALAYAGHQFGHYVPLLGDGRAIILGEVIDKKKCRWDIQLKGSGRTAFSRMGDGRAPLSAVIREYLISEAMHGLKIPTTRALAAVETTECVYREKGAVPMGVLARAARSHIRVGSFQFARQKGLDVLTALADYILSRHFPTLIKSKTPYLHLFETIVDSQAKLIAEWMGVGFIHGVMNTDNMSIIGETIDYGPCAFMDEFDFNTVFSSIDLYGRYCFGQQPSIAYWNLAQLAQALSPLVDPKDSSIILESFPHRFHTFWKQKVKLKLGLTTDTESTDKLIKEFFDLLQENKPDYTNTFRLLADALYCSKTKMKFIALFKDQEWAAQWFETWLNHLQNSTVHVSEVKNKMNQVNPLYIPRNHLVESAIKDYIERQDMRLIDRLLALFKAPYRDHPHSEEFKSLPTESERVRKTFCGT